MRRLPLRSDSGRGRAARVEFSQPEAMGKGFFAGAGAGRMKAVFSGGGMRVRRERMYEVLASSPAVE